MPFGSPPQLLYQEKIKGAAPPIQSHYQPKITASVLPYLAHVSSLIIFSKRHGKSQSLGVILFLASLQ